ncbi:hypothetical protein FGO68_gene10173 [Halteria grandinella]|uniref:Uncharacterized protein n=1 Tax=Halteria grandinella TaxID=5974 RepID=A0A8J8NPZ4_HALGN|nr:hypothetical protein FGO68_gene10173 [Halteria grandinella]
MKPQNTTASPSQHGNAISWNTTIYLHKVRCFDYNLKSSMSGSYCPVGLQGFIAPGVNARKVESSPIEESTPDKLLFFRREFQVSLMCPIDDKEKASIERVIAQPVKKVKYCQDRFAIPPQQKTCIIIAVNIRMTIKHVLASCEFTLFLNEQQQQPRHGAGIVALLQQCSQSFHMKKLHLCLQLLLRVTFGRLWMYLEDVFLFWICLLVVLCQLNFLSIIKVRDLQK